MSSSIEVIPIKDKGLELDFIIALQIAWHTAENKIIMNIRFIDNYLIFIFFHCLWLVLKLRKN